MKTFGTLTWFKGAWIIDAEPHVLIRLKRLFPRIARKQDFIGLADTTEVSRELEWFCSRYPLAYKASPDMSEAAVEGRLAERSRSHRDGESFYDNIVKGIQPPTDFRLALPARGYQKLAGTVILSTPGILLADDLGLGKQHPIDTKILTPCGYVEIGKLRIGDSVIGSHGAPTRIKGVFPQGVKPSYRVAFSDGSAVEAGPEHLWTVRYMKGGRDLSELVVTTEQLRTGATVTRTHNNGVTATLSLGKPKLYLPLLTGSAQFSPLGPLPIPPYTMGQLIANGSTCTRNVVITSHADDAEFVRARLATDGMQLGLPRTYGKACRVSLLGLLPALRSLELTAKSRDKFIPEVYLRSSVEDRVQLLHGMMDGDGSVSAERSRVSYSTSSRRLAEDMRELVECLGGVASIQESFHKGKPQPEYSVRVRTPAWVEPFSLPRKAARYAPKKRRIPTRSLAGIEYVRDVESVCIAVEAPDQLYAAEHAILTHNTCSVLCALSDARTRPALVVTLTHLPAQWESECRKFLPRLTTHVLQGTRPYDIAKRFGGKTPDLIITSYSKLAGWADALRFVKFVAYDEIQELRNGTDTKKGEGAAIISRHAQFRVGTSATPVYNLGGEMHSVMEFVRPGALGTRAEFAREWCTSDAEKPGKMKIKNPAAMGSYLRDSGLMLRRTRKDVGREVPKITRVPHTIDCDVAELNKIEGKAIELARIIMSKNTQARGQQMQASSELNNLVRQATGVAKAGFVAEFVRMLADSDERVVVFLWHREVYDVLMESLSDEKLGNLNPVMYSGTESAKQKAEAKERFCGGDARVLLMSLRAGAGLDGLQHHCRIGVFAELDWSSGVMEQDEGRIARDGQPDPTLFYYLLSTFGSDPIISDVLGIKKAQLEGIRDPSGAIEHGLDADGQNVRKLAQAYLLKRAQVTPNGIRVVK